MNGVPMSLLPVAPSSKKVISVTAGLRHQFARLPVDHTVNQNGRLRGVPIVDVVRRCLKYQTSFPVSGLIATIEHV